MSFARAGRLGMSNSDKNRHGKSFQESIEYFIVGLNSKQELCKLEANKRLGYAGYDPEQFYIPYEIEFQDGTTWAVYSTTSMRDRFKCQLWDAYNLKQIDDRIEYAWLVYPDSINEKERKAFQGKAKAIEGGCYYSSIDFIAPESEFQSSLEEKAMLSAGLSSGVRGDRRGRMFESHVVKVMNDVKNLSLAKGASKGVESGYFYSMF